MVTILPQLRQVREDLVHLLDRDMVQDICRALGHTWRDRRLDPYTTLHLFILQILNRNTAMTHLPHLSGGRFTASAYCRARQRLPLELLVQINGRLAQALTTTEQWDWHGHRLWLEDGSGFSMPDEPELQKHFGQPGGQKPGCGFPVGHLLGLFDADSGMIGEVIVSPLRTHDLAHAAQLHPRMSAGDVLVGDRGFCSYAHLALLLQANLHGVFRIHQRQIVSFHPHRPSADQVLGTGHPNSDWVQRLGHCDQLVDWHKPKSAPKWMSREQFAQLPEKLRVRELKFKVHETTRVHEITLVTTLLDAERYPAAELAELYRRRWQIEVDLRSLKITLGMDVLKSKKLKTVLKEVQAFVLVYNLVRAVMVRAAQNQKVHPTRVSFIDAMRWLQPPKPDGDLPKLLINPDRRGRFEPRCRKRRPKQYVLMNEPRKTLRKRLRKRRRAA